MIKIDFNNRQISQGLLQRAEAAFKTVITRGDLGFLKAAERMHFFEAAAQRAHRVRTHFNETVFVGIGGSSLGARTVYEALRSRAEANFHRLHFFDNLDSVAFWQSLKALREPDKTHFVLASKSGGTLETVAMTEFLAQELKSKGLSLHRQATVISSFNDSPLNAWMERHSVPHLEIPSDVGGRYSVLGPIGYFPAALLQVNIKSFQEGIEWALDAKAEVTELIASSLASFDRGEWITSFWLYSQRMESFGAWWQQLWAESLAKKVNRKGSAAPRVSTPFVAIGARDQHSLLQQWIEGYPDKSVWLLRVAESESSSPALKASELKGVDFLVGRSLGDVFAAEAEATLKALDQTGIATLGMRIENLDARTLAALFMFHQLVVAGIAEALDINAFDQPGVELGKKLAKIRLQNQ